MTQPLAVQLLGFAGSALIITGVMMRPVTWLRSFALVGSLTFVVYGILISAWPIVLTNITTTTLHAFHLRAHDQTRRRFAAAERCAADGDIRADTAERGAPTFDNWSMQSSNGFVTAVRRMTARWPRLSASRSAPRRRLRSSQR